MTLLWVKPNQTKKYKLWSPESCTVQLKLLLHFRANISHRVACHIFKLGMGSTFEWNIILVWSLNLTAGCGCAFLNDPWGSPVQKCHPRIAACPVVFPAVSQYGFVAPDKPLSLTDGEQVSGNAKWDSCCLQYLAFLCKWLWLSQKSLICFSLSTAAKLPLILVDTDMEPSDWNWCAAVQNLLWLEWVESRENNKLKVCRIMARHD